MNTVFPDYDFSDKKTESFQHENAWKVRASVNQQLQTSLSAVQSSIPLDTGSHLMAHTSVDSDAIVPKLWAVIEEIIGSLDECVCFSYKPEDGDPFGESGVLWSFNYFFFNQKLKRIMYFTVMARQAGLVPSSSPRLSTSGYHSGYGSAAENTSSWGDDDNDNNSNLSMDMERSF
jgi:hypothetical protein